VVASSAAGNPLGITGFIVWADLPALNDSGDVAFPASGKSAGAVWLSRSGHKARPMASVASNHFPSEVGIDNGGSVSFSDTVASGEQTTQIVAVTKSGTTRYPTVYNGDVWAAITDPGSVIVQSGGALLLLAKGKSTQINKGFCDGSFSVAATGAGVVAYSDCTGRNIYVTDSRNGSTTLVAPTDSAEGIVGQPAISSQGLVAFSATGVAGQTGSNINAVYTVQAGSVSLITYTNNGTCSSFGPPGGKGSCDYVSYDPASINASGTILVDTVTASFTGTAATYSEALRLNADRSGAAIFATGHQIDHCKVNGVYAGNQSLNASGQVAALLSCTDLTDRIVVATPAP
jgi:hypothetical protein